MWFVLPVVCAIGIMVFLGIRNQKQQNIAKQIERDAYNQKVKALGTAKELLRSNPNLMSLYRSLVSVYSSDQDTDRNERSRIMVRLMKVTDDLELVTAVCALARIEAKKRKQQYVKNV